MFAMGYRVQNIVILLVLVPLTLAQTQVCGVLPSDANALLKQRFPAWRPTYLSDLVGDDHNLWLETHPKECPGIAVGHFEQPDRDAYAILLVPKSGQTAGYKIIMLSKPSGEYVVRLLDKAEGSDSGLVISREPPGTYSEFGDAKSVHLTLDGVNVEWLEKSSVLYYWSHGKYRSIATSD
jgi:hypothetical protein